MCAGFSLVGGAGLPLARLGKAWVVGLGGEIHLLCLSLVPKSPAPPASTRTPPGHQMARHVRCGVTDGHGTSLQGSTSQTDCVCATLATMGMASPGARPALQDGSRRQQDLLSAPRVPPAPMTLYACIDSGADASRPHLGVACDIACPNSRAEAIASLIAAKFTPSILVNNAGVTQDRAPAELERSVRTLSTR
jgi:NAD(P)-dependent dehydrogenase (short-subunit alcohol dehydrogenase family)